MTQDPCASTCCGQHRSRTRAHAPMSDNGMLRMRISRVSRSPAGLRLRQRTSIQQIEDVLQALHATFYDEFHRGVLQRAAIATAALYQRRLSRIRSRSSEETSRRAMRGTSGCRGNSGVGCAKHGDIASDQPFEAGRQAIGGIPALADGRQSGSARQIALQIRRRNFGLV